MEWLGLGKRLCFVRLFVWSSNMFNSDLTDITQTLLLPALVRTPTTDDIPQ